MYTTVHKCENGIEMNNDEIERVGVRELRNNLPKYLSGESPLEVVRHGQTIGYYFPIHQKDKLIEIKALKDIAKQVEALLEEKGLSEDEVLEDFQELRTKDRKSKRTEKDSK